MKPKNIIVAWLLIGVVSLAFAQSKEPRGKPAAAPAGTNAPAKVPPVVTAAHKVIAYYFHRTVRCETCLAIEMQAQATIEVEFASALQTGALEWYVINIEATGNVAFVTAYDLTLPALVLVDSVNGRPVRWNKLNRVWDFVHNPSALAQYVQTELRNYLGEPQP